MKKDHNNFCILKCIETDNSVSQRKLASRMELNISSLGFILDGLINKGFVKRVGEFPMSTKYYITPEGLSEKNNLAYKFYCQSIPYFEEVRNDIEAKIVEATNGIETNIAIYGTNELSEITYMVVSKMGLTFLGFFGEDSKITNEKLFGYDIQRLNLLQRNPNCLLLLTEGFPADELNELDTKNVDTLNLVENNSVRLN